MENFDIRASFKLVPQSPSLLDHITKFTSWVPAKVVLPDISPEAHARKMQGDFSPPESLEDLKNAALEAFAISAPLIDLHPIKSACGRKTVEEEDDGPALGAGELVTSTKGKPPLKVHPHVVTRYVSPLADPFDFVADSTFLLCIERTCESYEWTIFTTKKHTMHAINNSVGMMYAIPSLTSENVMLTKTLLSLGY